MSLPLIVGIAVASVLGIVVLCAVAWRRVVPNDQVHVVRSRSASVAYGNGMDRNVYYEVPSHFPYFGVVVSKVSTSNFPISFEGYDAYDLAKVPFAVDITAFFQVSDPLTVAKRVTSMDELQSQLSNVVKGAVRRVLAGHDIEKIMGSRSELSKEFVTEVGEQTQNWGIKVLNLEFMDISDWSDTHVITQIQNKEKSTIDMASRTKVAENEKTARLAEIAAAETAALRDAERVETVSVRQEKAKQVVAEQGAITKARDLEVVKVETVKNQEIVREKSVVIAQTQKDVDVINAEKDVIIAERRKDAQLTTADGNAMAAKRNAEGVRDANVLEGDGQAQKVSLVGNAEADVIKATGVARADAQDKMAEALTKQNAGALGMEEFRVKESVETAKWRAIGDGLKAAEIKIVMSPAGARVLGVGLDAEGGATLTSFIEQLPASLKGHAQAFADKIAKKDSKESAS